MKCITCGLPTIPFSDRCVTHYSEAVEAVLSGKKVEQVEPLNREDVISALTNLGYRKTDAKQWVNEAINSGITNINEAILYVLKNK